MITATVVSPTVAGQSASRFMNSIPPTAPRSNIWQVIGQTMAETNNIICHTQIVPWRRKILSNKYISWYGKTACSKSNDHYTIKHSFNP